MNIYAILILLALVVNYILNLISDILNLKTLDAPMPKEFEEIYDTDKYDQSREYTRVRTRFGLIASTFSLGVLLLFWFVGGFNWLDGMVRELDQSVVVSGVLFVGALMIAQNILSLPFSIYSTFVIEEKFGFNKTTAATFVMDRLKGLLLLVLLGLPLLAGILFIFEYLQASAWVFAWIVIVLFTLFVQFIAPTWIMPLFNKFTPIEEGELKDAILSYADRVSFPLQGIYVIDGSRRSGKSNAFFTGFGKNKRIALYDTLIEKHTVEELVAVLAHEIGHYKKKHIPKNMVFGFLQTGLMLFILSLFIRLPGLHEAFFMDHISVYAGLLFFGLLYTPVDMLLSFVTQYFSRKYEFEADQFAAETTEDPESMISVLKKLSVNNLSNLTPHPFYVWLNYSHPPVLKRVQAIKALGVNFSQRGCKQ
ncbi:M48 family metallopeptidase [Balneolaceae bacterium ANBcel3]|nr:M48 family metallopeptidase [Balneolaceae bacterium ANBcel3]